MPAILAYLFYFLASTASPLQRRWLAKYKNPSNNGQVLFAFQISLITSVMGIALFFYQPFALTGNPFYLFGLSLICGIAGTASYTFSYIAQKHVEAGVTSVLSNIYTPVTIILATFFLHETLSTKQIIGALILFISMIIVSNKHRTGRITFDKYFLLMLASGIFLGILITAERSLQKITGFTTGTLLSWWSTTICLGLFLLTSHTERHSYTSPEILLTGVLRFFQNVSWVTLVYVVGNLSIVSAITTFKVVIMFIAGALFLRERDNLPRKIIGSLLAVGGLLLMK